MWDMQITRPLMTFDLGYAVGDIEWAPYSSTVFAAVTSAGMLYVWDLHEPDQLSQPLCSQIRKRNRPDLAAFRFSDGKHTIVDVRPLLKFTPIVDSLWVPRGLTVTFRFSVFCWMDRAPY